MLNAKRHLLTYGCAVGFLGLTVSGPAAEAQQEPGAAGYELQEGWRQLLEERARAAEQAELLGLPLLTVTATDAAAAEPADPARFTFTRSGPYLGPLAVRYVVRGDAVNGEDYGPLSGVAEIPDGEASVSLEVPVIDDPEPEGHERVSLEILPDPGYVVGSPRTALVRIADNDGFELQALAPATPGPRQAVDVSHWSGSGWSADCFVENGVTHLIAGTQRQSITRAQLDAAVAAGMTVDAYVYLYWGSSITAQVQYALETIQGYPVTRLWLDAENSAAGYTPSQILQKIQEGLDACGSTPCGIYTAKWWWDPATNYSTAFADVPLWYARYDLNPDFNDWYNGYSDFGGWVDPTGKQYQGSNYFCGVNVDKNVMHVGAAPTAPFQGETGRVTTRQADASTWHGVAFEHGYTAPVVVMQPLSFNGGDPTTIRIRNVTSTGFEWQMDEWDYKDGAHTTETVAYLVMESGVFQLEGGTLVEAGTVSADHNFVTVALDQGFAETPVILTQAQTYADPAAVVTRQRNAGPGGFEVRLQEQEANDPAHALETVGYVAVAPGLGMTAGVAFEAALTPDAVTHAWYGLTFQDGYGDPVLLAGLQTRDGGDTAGLRYRNLQTTSVEMFVEEETSRDTEVAHTTEVVGYLVFDHPGSLTEDGGGNNPPPAPTGLSPDGGQEFPNGSAVTMSSDPIAGASQFEFAIEHDSGGGAWATYYTYTSTASSFTFWPQYDDREYRFRMRAENAYGWGPYSAWALFVVGNAGGDDPPPAPTGLSPDGGQVYPAGGAVVLSCTPLEATEYEFQIEYSSAGTWKTYYTYTTSGSSKTFYPAVHGTDYRFRVRARNAFGWGPYSAWAWFHVNG